MLCPRVCLGFGPVKSSYVRKGVWLLLCLLRKTPLDATSSRGPRSAAWQQTVVVTKPPLVRLEAGVVSCSCTFIYIRLRIFVSLLVLGAFCFLLPVHRKRALSWCCVHTLSLSPLSCWAAFGTCSELPRFVPRLV